MAPRFDAAGSTLELAVADLLDAQLLRSIGFANRGGYERMWLGQAIHSRYQEAAFAADPTYQSEVRVEHCLTHRGFTVKIHGRVDGLRRSADGGLVVEEIKSVRRGNRLAPWVRELYERQAGLYAWLLTHQLGVPVGAELILIEIGSDRVEREPVAVDLTVLTAIVKRRLSSLIRGFQAEQKARQQRVLAGERLPFPYPEVRPGQAEIMAAVAAACTAGEHLLLAAPTGLGKTVAALHPTLQFALVQGKRVFVLTAKTLQQDMATQVLQLLNAEHSFHSLRLRAKAKMCANDQVLCHEEYCNYARDYFFKVQESRITEELLAHFHNLQPETIFSLAKRAEVCPFEISLDLVGKTQVVVCDYNYAFEPYVALTDFSAQAELKDTLLIIDEIHNLVDRGRRYYSPQLSALAARRASEEAALGGALIHQEIASLCAQLARLIEHAVEDAAPPGAPAAWAQETRLPEDELWRLRPQFDQTFIEYLEYRRDTRTLTPEDRFVDLYFAVLKFLNALVLKDATFSHFVERQVSEVGLFPQTDHRLCILCKDPSRFLGAVINRCQSVIGLSATLSPPEFYRDLLGFDPARTTFHQAPNPFPRENRQVVIDSSVATTYRDRPHYTPRIAAQLARFADAVPGNCLALFPSYQFLTAVASQLKPQRKRILVQRQTDSDLGRQEMLETLRTAIFGDVLLLAVAGGVFAEGVDYPGDMLKAVAVIGPCLPAVTLDQQLLQDYYEERFERGFEYAYVVPGMTRVVQAAGRLIRSATDTGVIALFDRRFLWRAYHRHLPPDWLPENGIRSLVGEPGDVAEVFFGQQLKGQGNLS